MNEIFYHVDSHKQTSRQTSGLPAVICLKEESTLPFSLRLLQAHQQQVPLLPEFPRQALQLLLSWLPQALPQQWALPQ